MSNIRYRVLKGERNTIVHYVKPKVAMEWVSRGLAELVGFNQIKMVTRDREVARTSDYLISSGQKDAYELASIEKHRRLVQGGSVNGLRRQLKTEPFSGAKVGHQ